MGHRGVVEKRCISDLLTLGNGTVVLWTDPVSVLATECIRSHLGMWDRVYLNGCVK
jgi:hypothetical protein